MRACRDCAYFLADSDARTSPFTYARCQNSATARLSPVSGARVLSFCADARAPLAECGPDAKFFEALAHGHTEDQDATVGATVLS